MQMIFRDMKTGTDWLFPNGKIWPVIPRIGEEVDYINDETEVYEIEGTVTNVIWSCGTNGDFSVFVEIGTPPNTACTRLETGTANADSESNPAVSSG